MTSENELSCAAALARLPDHVFGFEDWGEAEAAALERHLASCDACRDARRDLAHELAPLGDLLTELPGTSASSAVEPLSSEARERIWARCERSVDRVIAQSDDELVELVRGVLPAGSSLVARASGPWHSLGIPGVRTKVLHMDREADRRTVLLQMDAGVTFPAHHHHADEELFVLRGCLLTGDVELEAGDYLRMDAGTKHEAQHSETGCLVLVIGSCQDAA